MTSKLLPEGTVNYNELNDLCMIVIAGFDIGGEGKHRYTVRRMYEGYPDKEVYDGEVTIYLNTKGIDADGVSDELVAMLTYFEETTNEVASSSGYERIARLHEIVTSIKASDEIGVKYMNAYEERIYDMQEAKEEGEASGRAAEKLEMAKAMKAECIDINTIVKVSGLSENEIEKL